MGRNPHVPIVGFRTVRMTGVTVEKPYYPIVGKQMIGVAITVFYCAETTMNTSQLTMMIQTNMTCLEADNMQGIIITYDAIENAGNSNHEQLQHGNVINYYGIEYVVCENDSLREYIIVMTIDDYSQLCQNKIRQGNKFVSIKSSLFIPLPVLTEYQQELMDVIADVPNINTDTWLYISNVKPSKRYYQYWQEDGIEPVIIPRYHIHVYRKQIANGLRDKGLLSKYAYNLFKLTKLGMRYIEKGKQA